MNRRLQELVIRTSPWPPFRWVYAGVYAVALAWLIARLRRVPEIRSLDLRPPRRGHCFGSSDLDLRAEVAPLSARAFFAFADRLADVLLPGGTWLRLFDLYAFPETEYELQNAIVAQSIGRERRWIRLLGDRRVMPQPPAAPADAALGRATYDYAALCQELFEGPLDLHRTRLVYGRVTRIHDERRARGDAVGDASDLAAEVLAAARPVGRGRVRRASFTALARAHAVALADVSALASDVRRAADDGATRTIEVVPRGTPPHTLEATVRSCREPLAALGAAARGAIRSAVLGAVPGSRWEYRITLVVHDDLTVEQHVELARAVRDLFVATNPALPYTPFRLRFPLVLTSAPWATSGRWYHALRPVEEHWFTARHGVVLYGEDLRDDVGAPGDAALMRSAAVGVADLRNRIWGALHHRRPRHLADLLAGRVPALWLVLARARVATSPAEVVAACMEHGFPRADVLAALHERLTGVRAEDVPPVDDAVWRPALDALTDWLDELAALALAAVTRPAAVAPARAAQSS